MKKRIISLLLIMTLILVLALPAYAAKDEYVSDEFEVLAQEELDELNETGAQLAEEYGVDVFFAHTYEDLEDFDVKDTFFKSDDYIALVTNEDYWDVFVKGTPEDFVDDEVEKMKSKAEAMHDKLKAEIEEARCKCEEHVTKA